MLYYAKKLTILKKQDEYKYLNECASQSLQMALRQLVTAFDNFLQKEQNTRISSQRKIQGKVVLFHRILS